MKIFDWMYGRLHPAADYRRVSHRKPHVFEEEARELSEAAHRLPATASPEIEPETEAPLLHHVLDGILTIGTLGHSDILLLPHHIEQEPDLEQPEVTQNPSGVCATGILPSPVAELFKPIHCIDAVVAISGEEDNHEEKAMAEPLLKEDREKKQRTTLADLFAAEPTAPEAGKEPDGCIPAKNALPKKAASPPSFKRGNKEKTKKKGEEEGSLPSSAAATKRLNKMIRRMLKKKIHPDAAAPAKKGGAANFEWAAPLLLDGGRAGSRSVA